MDLQTDEIQNPGQIFEKPKQFSVEMLMDKSDEELQVALEELRKKDLQYSGVLLQSLLPSQGRCPVCTLKVPCKHYSSIDQIPKQKPVHAKRSVSPILNLSCNLETPESSSLSVYSASSGQKSLQMRFRTSDGTVYQDILNHPQRRKSLEEYRKLKQIEKIEIYRENKLRKEIEKIEELKRQQAEEKEKLREAEEKRKKYAEKQKAKIRAYRGAEMNKKKPVEGETEIKIKNRSVDEPKRRPNNIKLFRLQELRRKKKNLDYIIDLQFENLEKEKKQRMNQEK
ncbi:unnamed protein product [Blepharisma stoltei]|uniref:Uncharacterized protein n=1 Tax=Blepharisma stoltei TaxID=1481888 RepID=A0AAU9IPG2_9CILI|nr:unnamed protein product [Blepharisma stoltei]